MKNGEKMRSRGAENQALLNSRENRNQRKKMAANAVFDAAATLARVHLWLPFQLPYNLL